METSNVGEIQKTEKKFKSYYVVWKLMHMAEIKKIAQGLDRTM